MPFRVVSEETFERLMVIRQLKPLAFSLEKNAEIPGLPAGFPRKAVHQRAKMARNLALADEFIQRLGCEA